MKRYLGIFILTIMVGLSGCASDTDSDTQVSSRAYSMQIQQNQIRVQTSSRGFGIWGDTKYNPIYQKTKKKYKEIGLFAARIAFEHPTTGERMVFKADPSGEAFALLEMTE